MKYLNIAKYPLIVIFFLSTLAPSFASDQEKHQAIRAATTFLRLVDRGDYTESWSSTATIFKKAISQKQWAEKATLVRGSLGSLVDRTLVRAQYTTTLPGAPDGEYVIITFKTKFQNKEKAIETITPMLDSDGHWRVSGYYIR